MRQNLRQIYDGVKCLEERVARTERNQDMILAVLQDIKCDVSKVSYHVHMDTPDITKIFPLQDNETLYKFLDNHDGKLDERKRELDYYLDTIISKTSSRQSLVTTVVDAIFKRQYIMSVKWPVSNMSKMNETNNYVPMRFVTLLRCTLPKLISKKSMDPSLIDLEFWKAIPRKFNSIFNYERAKSVIFGFLLH